MQQSCDMEVGMEEYIWRKSWYKLFKGRWGISIQLEAGYQMVFDIEDKSKYIELAERIYFHSLLFSSPNNPRLTADEYMYFCNGLKLVSRYLYELLPDDLNLIIALRSIQFSDCYVQIEGFTACAIQWASETFRFSMPAIEAYFDKSKSQYGMYVFDFSSV